MKNQKSQIRNIFGNLNKSLLYKLASYSTIGVLSGLVYFLVTNLFINYLSGDAKLSSIFGYCAAIPINYLLNRKFSFRSDNAVKREILGFLLTHILGMIVSYSFMALFVDKLGFDPVVPSVLIIFAIPAVNFIILNKCVFVKYK